MSHTRLSFVIPARNEEALIAETLEAILASVARASGTSRAELWLPDTVFEVIVCDDGSDDATPAIVASFVDDAGVRLLRCVAGTCAAARNAGAAASAGRILCFVDADTIVPENTVDRIIELHEDEGRCLVLYRLVSREPGIRAWLWWTFWGLARRLPLAKAKSMPACMRWSAGNSEPALTWKVSRVIASMRRAMPRPCRSSVPSARRISTSSVPGRTGPGNEGMCAFAIAGLYESGLCYRRPIPRSGLPGRAFFFSRAPASPATSGPLKPRA